MDWQPMETVPRDGQPVVLRFTNGCTGVVVWKDDGYEGDVVLDAQGSVIPELVPCGWKPAIAVMDTQGNA